MTSIVVWFLEVNQLPRVTLVKRVFYSDVSGAYKGKKHHPKINSIACIALGYSLEASRGGAFNEYPQHMFS